MKRSRKVKIFLSLIVVIVIGLISGYYNFFVNSQEDTVLGIQESEEEADVQEDIDFSKVPYIDSLPPVVGYEGVLYEYLVRPVGHLKDLDLTLEYVEGPPWLSLNNYVLRGIPPFGSSGSYRIVLRVSDGYNSSVQEEYILIQEVGDESF